MKTALLFIVLIFAILLSLSVGSSDISFNQVLSWIFGQSLDSSDAYILTELRLPRTLTCIAVGGGLALAGFLLQLLLDNPLAEPYTLGLSGGASLGALSALLLGLSPQFIAFPSGGFVGCLLVGLVVLAVILRTRNFQSRLLVLFGIMISLFCGAIIVVMVSLLEPQQMTTAMQWMMGHSGTARDLWWPMTASVLTISVLWSWLRARPLDSLLLGENLAQTSGTHLKKIRIEIVLAVSFLTATSVALMGLVGFVGLIAPHASYFLIKSRRVRASLVSTVILGALTLLSADIVGRLIGGDREIPAGSLVALVGAPFLAWLIIRRFRYG